MTLSAGLVFAAHAQNREVRNTGPFTRVGMGVSGTLHLTQGSEFKVSIEGPKRLLEDIVTRVEKGRLVIKYKSWGPHLEKVDVFITMPEIEGLSVSGSGEIYNETPLRSEEIDLAVSGSGRIRLDRFTAEEVSAKISGSGAIIVSGKKCSDLEVAISGSGQVDTQELQSREVSAKISGSGSARVYAGEKLDASISGSGNVRYSGHPVVNARVSGSGKVRTIN